LTVNCHPLPNFAILPIQPLLPGKLASEARGIALYHQVEVHIGTPQEKVANRTAHKI
jgi:hypothetical protein